MSSLSQLDVYNSSDSEDDSNKFCNKNKIRLPLPDMFSNNILETDKKLQVENKSGKIRNFPHEKGNWATYIHIPVEPYLKKDFKNYFEELKNVLQHLDLKIMDDFHISLTKTVVLKYHWISDFVKSINENLKQICCFKVNFCGLKTYTNEQNNRTFVSLVVNAGTENLKNIVDHLDNCLKDYNLQPFHKDPSFHLSLLWCCGNKCDEINNHLKKIPIKLKTFAFEISVSHCICTTGNKNFRFNFIT